MEAALLAINSVSMPKRCLILLSTSLLSSALAGTETTTFFGGFNDLAPFVLRRLPGLRAPNPSFQDRARDENEKK